MDSEEADWGLAEWRAHSEWLETALESAMQILRNNEELLRDSAKLLLEKETLNEPEIKALIARIRPLSLAERQPETKTIPNGREHTEQAGK